jgi:hypothetical protein
VRSYAEEQLRDFAAEELDCGPTVNAGAGGASQFAEPKQNRRLCRRSYVVLDEGRRIVSYAETVTQEGSIPLKGVCLGHQPHARTGVENSERGAAHFAGIFRVGLQQADEDVNARVRHVFGSRLFYQFLFDGAAAFRGGIAAAGLYSGCRSSAERTPALE